MVERGDKRVFATARDWPGWSRSGRDQEEAISALLSYGPRYARVLKAAGLRETLPGQATEAEVVERHAGGSGTDFGVPGATAKADGEPLSRQELRRERTILEASWKAFDAAARKANGRSLRRGPRGGGRSLEKMMVHVLEAEIAYLGQLGSRHMKPTGSGDELAAVREEALAALEAIVAGKPVDSPRNTKKPWTPRYFIRRSAWHSLDHAWELEDRIED
jgi:hypothetical protein